eukprot:CAMPEP_0202726930 /NCGR_PEP_ID=MMETSP1385-20130828/184861_1 /ASSEMBLY_ACC=CAM_ASM_000861 /TAXON_ID=933848 /ORGANISM="Elphidium margaritaceum" /LENGTH=765 /DNA_ID=CAMNT_0049393159 /DNA_START=51 /DNA_END=2348 /DNA_ORIENTATION=-
MSLYPTRDRNYHKAIDQRINNDSRRHIYGYDAQSLLLKHAYPELCNNHNHNHNNNNGASTPPTHAHWSAIGISQYRILRKVGSGTYGSVFHATAPCPSKHTEVAIKQLAPMQNEKALFDGFHITAIREIKILKSLHHTNIIKLHDVICDRENIMQTYEDAINANKTSKNKSSASSARSMQTYMIFEYMEHDLSGLLHNDAFTAILNMSHIKYLLCQILNALQYCHETALILHRDLKSSNLLVDRYGVVKIADFGLARQYIPELCTSRQRIAARHCSVVADHGENGSSSSSSGGGGGGRVQYPRQYTNRVVTLWYRAPELLLSDQNYSAAVDLWSVGCVFAEMLFTRPMFQGQNEWQQWCQIVDVCGWLPEKEALWMSKLRDKHLLIAGMMKKKGKRLERKLRAKLQPFLDKEVAGVKYLDANGYNLLNTLLTLNPSLRCSAKEACRNKWFLSDPLPAPPPLEHVHSSHDYHQRQTRKNPNYRNQQQHQLQQQHAAHQHRQQPQPHAQQASSTAANPRRYQYSYNYVPNANTNNTNTNNTNSTVQLQQQHAAHQHRQQPQPHAQQASSTAANPRRYQYSYNYVPNANTNTSTNNTNSTVGGLGPRRHSSNPNLAQTSASNNYRRRNSLPTSRDRSRSRSRSRSRALSSAAEHSTNRSGSFDAKHIGKDAVVAAVPTISIPPPMPRFPVLHNNAQAPQVVTLQAPNLNRLNTSSSSAAVAANALNHTRGNMGVASQAKFNSAYNPDQPTTFYARYKRPDELKGRSRF